MLPLNTQSRALKTKTSNHIKSLLKLPYFPPWPLKVSGNCPATCSRVVQEPLPGVMKRPDHPLTSALILIPISNINDPIFHAHPLTIHYPPQPQHLRPRDAPKTTPSSTLLAFCLKLPFKHFTSNMCTIRLNPFPPHKAPLAIKRRCTDNLKRKRPFADMVTYFSLIFTHPYISVTRSR